MFLFVLLCTAVFFIDGHADDSRLWDEYYTVGVPSGQAESIINEGIFGEADIVSFYNTSLNFNDFGTMENVALADLSQRFVEGDPRVDPFAEGAANYFHSSDTAGSEWELFYVKNRKSVWDFYFKTRRSAGRSLNDWVFPDFSIKSRLSALILFAVSWLFGIRLAKGLRLPAAAAGVPWMISVVVNGAGMLPAAVSIYIVFILLIRESYSDVLFYLNYRKVRMRPGIYLHAGAFLIITIASMVVTIRNNLPVIPVLISAAAGFICVFISYSIKSQRVSMQEHRLFFPVCMKSKTSSESYGNKLPETAAAAAAIILIPMFVLFFQEESPIEVPVPQNSAASFSSWSWESLEYIDKTYEGLVNSADLLTHEAYQAGFMFDRAWEFPVQNEELMLGTYVAVNNEIEYRETCILQFTEQWYTSIIKPKLSTGLPALLLSQKTPGGIILKSDISEAVSSFNPVSHVFFSLLAILPIFGHIFSNVRITVRRKGQLA